eukprot:Awhi_evm2s739
MILCMNEKKGFNDFVMRVGNGEEPVLPGTEDTIRIPDEMLLRVDVDRDETAKIKALIQSTDHYHDENYFSDRAILSTKNIYVADINDEISKMCPGLPQHELKLKIGQIVMLMRNLRPSR